MIEIQANPDLNSLKMWLGTSIGIMLLLVAVVGYFLSRRDEAVTVAIINLNKVVDQLEIVVGNIRIEQEIRNPILAQQLELHRNDIAANAEKIEDVDKRLVKIESQHEDAYCRFPAQKKKGEKQQ